VGELHVNMHVTLDGVVSANGGPTEVDGDFRYAGWEWPYSDRESGDDLVEIIERSDALLLGRRTYDIFRAHWPGRTDRIGLAFDRVPKYVASRGAPVLSWSGTKQLRDAASELPRVLDWHREVQLWGSVDLLQSLLTASLVDAMNLWVSPVVLGEGARLFPPGSMPNRFEAIEPPRVYPAGSMLLRYRCLKSPPPTWEELQASAPGG